MMALAAFLRSIGRRIGLAAASLGLLGQVLGGMVVAVPMLMVATPAQAAAQCSNASLPYVALYTSGATAMSNVTIGDFGSIYCSGLPVSQSFNYCVGTGASGTYNLSYQNATSSSGATVQFRLKDVYNGIKYFADGLALNGSSSNSQGTSNVWFETLGIDIPQQTVTAGDYVGTYVVPMEIRSSSCTGSLLATFSMVLRVTIRVGGSCSIGWSTGVDFGTITADGSGNIAQSSQFTSIGAACSVGQSFTLTLSNGNNQSGTGNYRWRMKSGQSYISYGFFTDRNVTSVPAAGVTYAGTGGNATYLSNSDYDGHATFNAYLGPNQPISSIEPGVYTDTVIATLSW